MDSAGRVADGWISDLQLESRMASRTAKKRKAFILIFMLLVKNGPGIFSLDSFHPEKFQRTCMTWMGLGSLRKSQTAIFGHKLSSYGTILETRSQGGTNATSNPIDTG